jgi:hypothetical protein
MSPGIPYVFPYKISEFIKVQYDRPAIYFGEAESLVKRISQYLRPGESQQTNVRVHLHLHRYVGNKSIVNLDVLDFAPFRWVGLL